MPTTSQPNKRATFTTEEVAHDDDLDLIGEVICEGSDSENEDKLMIIKSKRKFTHTLVGNIQ